MHIPEPRDAFGVGDQAHAYLLKIRPMILAIPSDDLDGIGRGRGIRTVERDGGGIAVQDIEKHSFMGPDLGGHGMEDRGRTGLRELIQGTTERIVIEIAGFHAGAQQDG